VLIAVDHLTRRKTESDEAFVGRAIRNPLARKIKVRDLEDNLNPLRHRRLDEKAIAKITRHHQAWYRIMNQDFY